MEKEKKAGEVFPTWIVWSGISQSGANWCLGGKLDIQVDERTVFVSEKVGDDDPLTLDQRLHCNICSSWASITWVHDKNIRADS